MGQNAYCIDTMLAQKQPSVNYDKSKYLVMGNKKFKNSVKLETDSNPVKMGGVELEQSECEKYLRDLKIADHGLLAGMGNNKTGITLFEALLFKCESWIGLNGTHITTLQSFQDVFICRLLHLPRIGTKIRV